MKSKEDYLKLVKEKFKMEEDTVIDSADLITKISEYLYSIDNPCADELKLAELSNELKCTLFNLFSDKDYYSNAAELTLGRIVDEFYKKRDYDNLESLLGNRQDKEHK